MAENRPAEAAFENLIGKQPLTDEELAALLNAADYDDRCTEILFLCAV